MNASSFNLRTSSTLLGMRTGFSSVRDRRRDGGRKSKEHREDRPENLALPNHACGEKLEAEPLAPEALQQSLDLVEQAVKYDPQSARSTHKASCTTRNYLANAPINENEKNEDE